MPTLSKYRSSIKPGDIIVWSKPPYATFLGMIFTAIVRFFTTSNYYHVGIIIQSDDSDLVEVGAIPPAVSTRSIANAGLFFHIPMGMNFTKDDEEWLRSHIGQKYSYWQAVKAWFGFFDADTQWICTEFVSAFLAYKYGKDFTSWAYGSHEDNDDIHGDIASPLATPSNFVEEITAHFPTGLYTVLPDKKK